MNQEAENLRYYFDNLWRWKCGLPEKEYLFDGNMPSLESLRKTEWCEEFEILMRNRLVMGALRYGKLNDPTKKYYNKIKEIKRRSEEYLRTHNTELLVDIANMALIEYVEGRRSGKEFKAIDEGNHAEPGHITLGEI